jgi:hypothetical protein
VSIDSAGATNVGGRGWWPVCTYRGSKQEKANKRPFLGPPSATKLIKQQVFNKRSPIQLLTNHKGAFRPVQLFVRTGGMRILPEAASRGLQRCKVMNTLNLCARATMRRCTVSPFQTGRQVQQSCVFNGYIRFLPCSASTFSVFSVCIIWLFIYQYDGVVQRKKYNVVFQHPVALSQYYLNNKCHTVLSCNNFLLSLVLLFIHHYMFRPLYKAIFRWVFLELVLVTLIR